jgi:8-oxo-dGTP diphosphatase
MDRHQDRHQPVQQVTRWTLGFLFDPTLKRVVLVRKARPAVQAGKLNAIGGQVEEGEEPIITMMLEAHEEVGAPQDLNWRRFAVLHSDAGEDGDFELHVFYAKSECVDDGLFLGSLATKTDEPATVLRVADVRSGIVRNLVPDLRWLMELALCVATFACPLHNDGGIDPGAYAEETCSCGPVFRGTHYRFVENNGPVEVEK